MKTECNVSKETIEKAYKEYINKRGTDITRFKEMEIDFHRLSHKEKDALWQLWILTLSYQAMREKASERIFRDIPKGGLVFDPLRILELTKECGCPLLFEANKVHFCDFQKSKGCSKRQFLEKCPIPKIRNEIRRLTRISKAIVSSVIYLQNYNFNFDRLYLSFEKEPIDKRTQNMLDALTIMSGEKTAHMFLGWVTNPMILENEKSLWELNNKRFLAIDVNIKRVAKNVGLCNYPNSNVIRAHLYELQRKLNVDNPKKTEIAFLHVGQGYCNKRQAYDRLKCPFYLDEKHCKMSSLF